MSFVSINLNLSYWQLIYFRIFSIQVQENEVRVNGLSLFRHGVSPEWEDDINKHGGELRLEFKSTLEFTQKLWDKLVFSVITGEFDQAEYVTGVRILDKSTSGRESNFRIEIWVEFSD